jgi:hypothetical protein
MKEAKLTRIKRDMYIQKGQNTDDQLPLLSLEVSEEELVLLSVDRISEYSG